MKVIVVVVALAALLGGAAAAAPSPRELYQQATALYNQGRFAEAATTFLDVYALTRQPLLLFNAAQACRKAGRIEEAKVQYRRFLDAMVDRAAGHGAAATEQGTTQIEEAHRYLTELGAPPAAAPAPPQTGLRCEDNSECGPGELCDAQRRCREVTAAQRPTLRAQAARPTMYAPSLAPPLPGETPPGWAHGAGISGIVLSLVALSLGMGAEVTRAQLAPALAMGGTATLLFGIDAPISAAGSASTRSRARVPGNLGLRVTGWISYSIGLAGALVMIGLVGQFPTPPPGIIAGVSALGSLGELFLSLDALVSWRQAEHALQQRRGAPRARWVAPNLVVF